MRKINIITLGCSKNLVDSEHLAYQLLQNNYKVEFEGTSDEYYACLINTCGFIHDAKQESIDMIFDIIEKKNSGKISKIGVFGCLTQLYRQQLTDEIPEVDKWFGKYELKDILTFLDTQVDLNSLTSRKLSTPKHYAYLKIAEGCSRACAFCSIPKITGRYTSQTIENLVEEATKLAENGTKELILIAQDLSVYGNDLPNSPTLTMLIKALSKIEKIKWIRLHYLYPNNIPEDLFDEINKNPKVCKYIDIPFQHISDKVLKDMNRSHDKEQTLTVIKELRSKIPEIQIRTTLMVGFPNETEADFEELLEFVQEQKFEKMGAFTYSHEEFTPAIKQFSDNVSEETKNQRMDKLMSLQFDMVEQINDNRIGKEYNIIIDKFEDNMYYARSEYESPDVDGDILIKEDVNLEIGEFYKTKIIANDGYDLVGTII